ncbi:aldo/keto reductase [Nocardioides solisilvae]|uniref:aldo/keto reductase n=1 Tax=Nocardioides solisilvae TaxID=1542435 RepID=UPI000D74A31E|nr:aldo/keto reductase [Nocardioides solisilvae]
MSLPQRRLGDLSVSAIGLGAMPLSVRGEEAAARATATIHAALDAGVTLIDTADCYAPDGTGLGHNERLVAEALATWDGDSDAVLVATKGGIRREGADWPVDGRPEWVREAVEGSLQRLGVERIGLYQHHRPDPAVPYADTIGAFAELVVQGKVARVGLSNADPAQIREAHGILGDALVSVQNRFSPSFRSSRPELELCAELGLVFLPWSPLGGISHAGDLGASYADFDAVARKHDASPQQVALAWELAQDDCVVPIPGASRPETILASLEALRLTLDADDVARLDASSEEWA